MSKKIEKLFKSYRDQLIHLAKLYGVVEVKSYARSAKRLTVSQLELLLISFWNLTQISDCICSNICPRWSEPFAYGKAFVTRIFLFKLSLDIFTDSINV